MPSRFIVSVILHVLALGFFWKAPRVVPRAFRVADIVHASGTEWPSRSSTAMVWQRVAQQHHEWLDSTVVPTSVDVVPQESYFQNRAIPIPSDIARLSEVPFSLDHTEYIEERRLRNIRRLDLEPSNDLGAAPPPDPGSVEHPAASDVAEPKRVEPARLLKKVVPVYPELAKTARVQGDVTIEATINESGALEDLRLLGGHPLLAPAALDAVSQWRYSPARLHGSATRSSIRITVTFKLELPQ